MKKIITLIFCMLFSFVFTLAFAQEKNTASGSEKTQLASDKLQDEGQKLDQEIENICKKINDVLVTYKLFQLNDIKFLPYRTYYNKGENYIEIEKYEILRDAFSYENLTGINKKKIKVYVSGDSLAKLETEIIEQYIFTGTSSRVLIIDPTPTQSGTDDISFSQISRNKVILENKTLSEIKNNRATPIRNDIKKEFLIPHITFLYTTLLDIAETYYKGVKDSDKVLLEFLDKSTTY